MQALVRKKFVIYYKPEFAAGESVRLVEGMDFFTRDNGFSVYDTDEVGNMDWLDAINVGPLMVWRVE